MRENQFVNLLDAPFSRRGSYFTFANDNYGEDVYGKGNLWLCNCRTVGFAMTNMGNTNNYRQIMFQAVKDGAALPSIINTTPYEVIIATRQGKIRFCIGEKKLVMAVCEDGLTLRIVPFEKMYVSSTVTILDDPNRQLIDFDMSHVLLTPITGRMEVRPNYIDILPDENGTVRAALEDCLLDPELRPVSAFPTYDECLDDVKNDFDEFCDMIMPQLPGEYEDMRLQALWQTWSMIVDPDDENDYKRTMVKMVHSIFEQAFVWQMPMQAIWLSKDAKLSWEIFCSSFEFQDRHGRLADAVAFKMIPGCVALKPPVQGLALLWLMENGVIERASPAIENKKWLLDRLIKWTEFYFNYRDHDHDGLCEYQHFLETGWEDAPQYMMGMPQISPDLNALLALQLEAIAKFGATVGMSEEDQNYYMNKSRDTIKLLLNKFWDGNNWHSINIETGMVSDVDNISLYLPLLLGDRLPQKVIEKSISNIFRIDGFNTPYGLTSEAMDSKYFRNGFSAGSVITPTHFFMCMALDACGRHDLATEIAVKYCRLLKENGFFHVYNAFSGREDRSLTAFGERGLFWSAWTSSCYLFLADKYCNNKG